MIWLFDYLMSGERYRLSGVIMSRSVISNATCYFER